MSRTTAWLLLIAAWVALPARAEYVTVNDFGNLLFWAGSGTNQAAFVAYFNDPVYGDDAAPAAVAWGYRWDGAQTQADMLFALAGSITVVDGSPPAPPLPQAGSDPRLAIDVGYSSFTNNSGQTISGWLLSAIRYDQVGLPAPWTQSVRTMDASGPPPENGWLYIAPYEFVPAFGTAWPAGGDLDLVADTGISDTPLRDRGWYGFVEAVYEVLDEDPPVYVGFPSSYAFAQPTAAVPEPRAITLAACGLGVLALGWRRRGRCRSRIRSRSSTHATVSTTA